MMPTLLPFNWPEDEDEDECCPNAPALGDGSMLETEPVTVVETAFVTVLLKILLC
jgi:hypothetical protein